MRRRVFAVASLALVGLIAGLVPPAAAVTPEPLPGTATAQFFSGWLPYWRGTTTIDRIVPRAGADGFVNEINVFWAYSRYNGTIQDPVCVHDLSDNKAQECARTAPTSTQQGHLARLKAAGIRVLPSFTDDSSPRALSAVLRNPSRRTWHINTQVGFVIDNGFDGIDLDYEDFAFSDGSSSWAQTKPAWIAYITELSAKLHAAGKILSVTVPAGYPVVGSGFNPSTGYWVYAWADIINHVDRLRLMTYDYSWDVPGAIGPATWVDEVAADAVEEVGASNAHKVWLGAAAYGYDWRTATTCGTPTLSRRPTRYPAQAWQIANDAKATNRLIALPGQTTPAVAWDAAKGEYWFRYRQADVDAVTGQKCLSVREVWFQDGRSHERRALIAAKYRLGGVAMWAFGDESDSTWSRLTAAAPSIKPYRPSVALSAPSKLTYGQAAIITATVTRPDSLPDPQVPVTLSWRPTGSTTWQTVATAPTGDTGTATFTHLPTRTGEYRLSTPPATGRQSSASQASATVVATALSVVVRNSVSAAVVSTVVNGQVTTSVKRKAPTQLWGYATPAAGQRVVLYRQKTDGSWSPISARTVAANGAYSFAIDTATAGTTIYQVRSASTPALALGRTATILIKVRP